MNKKEVIKRIFGQIMTEFDYDKFEKTHPKLLQSIHSVMEVAAVQGQLSTIPGIDPVSLKIKLNEKN